MALRSKGGLFWITRGLFVIGILLFVLSQEAHGSTREALQFAALAVIVLGFAIPPWRRAWAALHRRTSRTDQI
jgi:hypothetical protein